MQVTHTRPYPTITQAFGLTCMLLLLTMLLGFVVGVFSAASGFPLASRPAVLALLNAVAFTVVLLWGRPRTRAPASAVFPFRSIPAAYWPPMLLTVLGLHVLLSEIDNIFRIFCPPPDFVEEIFGVMFGVEAGIWEPFFLLVIVAPITEELLFRGMILRGFLLQYSARTAIVVSALMFALFHLNPWQFVAGFGLGGLFAWWFARTRSLWPCVAGHALNNSLALLVPAVLPNDIPGYAGSIGPAVTFQPAWFDVAGLLMLTLGLLWTTRLFRAAPAPRVARPASVPIVFLPAPPPVINPPTSIQ